MKKKKAKKGGVSSRKEEKVEASATSSAAEKEDGDTDPAKGDEVDMPLEEAKGDAEAFNNTEAESRDAEEPVGELVTSQSLKREPSITEKSKMRSSSFRMSTGPLSPKLAFSPEGETAPEIYRKQAAKIEELEKENRRLAKEASDGEKRWKKAEGELEDLREAQEGDLPATSEEKPGILDEEVKKLVRGHERSSHPRQLL